MEQSVAFIGLGSMGTPMAMNLLRAKMPLYVFNRTPEKAAPLVKEGAQLVTSPSACFQKARIVVSMLANDNALEEVTMGPKGLLESIQAGCIHVSMSTVSPEISRKLTALHRDKGAHYVTAPVFGRPDVAALAKLWICLAGNPEAKKQVVPILQHLGQRVEDFGEDPASANIVKVAGNFMILSAIETMGEAMRLAEKNGIRKDQMIAFFSETLFQSPVYKTYGKILSTSAFKPAGLKLTLGLKDINLVQDTARASQVPMPFADVLHHHLVQGIAEGRADWDWSAITLSVKE